MPQWRKLHTKTVESLDVDAMSDDFTRLTWCLLPLVCCREGRGILNANWLKSKLFPIRSDVTPELVWSAFGEFQDLGMINSYAVNGRKYFEIVNWHEYQGNTNKEAPSPYPSPLEDGPTPDLLQTNSRVGPGNVEKYPSESASASVSVSSSSERPAKMNLPVHLHVGDLPEAWGRWLDYHDERGKPLTVSTALAQFAQFEKLGPETSTKAINNSILNNYTGLIAPAGQKNGKPAEPKGFAAAREIMEEISHVNN